MPLSALAVSCSKHHQHVHAGVRYLVVMVLALVTAAGVVCSTVDRARMDSRKATATKLSTTRREHESPYYAFVGNNASFRGYLNAEFHQIIQNIAADRRWTSLGVDDDGGGDRKAARVLTWSSIDRRAIEKYGHLPAALLFTLKFHWNYAAMAQLGTQRRHQGGTNGTQM
jgi:hypothetical protein